MVAEKTEVHKGTMTREQKEHFVTNYYYSLEDKKSYCVGLADVFAENGYNVHWFSLQSNFFSRGILPKEEIKINLIYEYTINYQSSIGGDTEEQETTSRVEGLCADTSKERKL